MAASINVTELTRRRGGPWTTGARSVAALAVLMVLSAGCTSTDGSPPVSDTGAGSPPPAGPVLGSGLLVTDPPHNEVQPFPAPGTCRARTVPGGVLPDSHCTPGAVDPHVTEATVNTTVCRPGGYTSTVRPPTSVTDPEKRPALAAYGQTASPSGYELDHLVPLSLGGTPNTAANLWPEPDPTPNPKDKLEGALHDLLCAHRISLDDAQRMIAENWITAYQQILGTSPPS